MKYSLWLIAFAAGAVLARNRNRLPRSRSRRSRSPAPMPAPEWAKLERQLLAEQAPACREFYEKYFDAHGYLQCFVRWGANDGPDDAFENFNGWPELHALGADDEIMRLYPPGTRRLAQTIHRGAHDRDADRAAGNVLQGVHRAVGLDAPRRRAAAVQPDGAFDRARDATYATRARRFAGFYMGEDPEAPNYDPKLKLIRSMQNGSRGPMLRKATALDWVGDSFDVGKFVAGHGESTYAAVPRALRGIHRCRGRSFPESRRDHAADERVPRGERAEVQTMDRRLHGRLAGSDEAERRRDSRAMSIIATEKSAARRTNGGAMPMAGDSAR